MSRPCQYCLAAYQILGSEECEYTHRDDSRVYELATAMAATFQQRPPTDEQVGWFLDDADAVIDDFDPPPTKWQVRKLPDTREFDCRFRINDVTYIVQPAEKTKALPVRLSIYRGWLREADGAA